MILEALSNAFGPPGCEAEVRGILTEAVGSLADECVTDHLGNLLLRQRGTANPEFRVMVAAHMDEVGFMITHADDAGLLHFKKVGGMDDRVLPAKVVRVGKDRVPGVFSMKPVHLTSPDERGKAVSADQLVIDIGAKSKDEAQRSFTVGDYAVFDTDFEDLGPILKGKAFDDRVGCAILAELLRRGPYPFDLRAAFTTMEEIGLRGARVAAYGIDPHAAFVLEGTICDDGPKERESSPVTRLGGGPALSHADRSAFMDRRLIRLVVDTARERGIPCQFKAPGLGGTDAGAIHLARDGVPSLAVSVPCRYIHSPVSMLSRSDLEQTVDLMEASLRKLTPDTVACRA